MSSFISSFWLSPYCLLKFWFYLGWLGGQVKTATYPASRRGWEGFVRWLEDFNRFHWTFHLNTSISTFSFQHFHPTTSILDFHNIFPNSLWLHSHRIFHLGFFIPRYPYQNFHHHFNTRFHLIFSITRFWVRGPRAARQWPAPLKQLQLSWTRCRKPTSGFIWQLNFCSSFTTETHWFSLKFKFRPSVVA